MRRELKIGESPTEEHLTAASTKLGESQLFNSRFSRHRPTLLSESWILKTHLLDHVTLPCELLAVVSLNLMSRYCFDRYSFVASESVISRKIVCTANLLTRHNSVELRPTQVPPTQPCNQFPFLLSKAL